MTARRGFKLRRHCAILSLSTLALILFFALASPAHACTCMRVEPCEAYADASTVFVGVVTKTGIEQSPGRLPPNAMSTTLTSGAPVAHLRVEEAFRGVAANELEIYGGGTTCDYYFKEGERYLVYAFPGEDGKTLYTNICSGTAPLAEARTDLAYLRRVKSSVGATVTGEVVRTIYRRGKDRPSSAPMVKAKVIFVSGARRFESRTNARGNFNLRGLPSGHYKVRTDPVTNASRLGVLDEQPREEWEVDLPDHGCIKTWFTLRPSGEISGHVYDEAGQLTNELFVDLIPADRKVSSNNFQQVKIDDEGGFKFSFVPPGSYYLGFNLHGGPSLSYPYAESYYPGVEDRAQATLITLTEDQKIGGLKLPVPLRRGERLIEGVAVWPDGRPMTEYSIELTNPRTGYREGNGVSTDSQGRFVIKAIEGQTYELSALIPNGVPLVNSKPIVIKVGDVNKPVRLVVELPKTARQKQR